MNDTLKAVVIELSGGNIRNHHINLRGCFGLFPDDCLGGENEAAAGKVITVRFPAEAVETDIDEKKAIFRKRAEVRRFFEQEALKEGDLVFVERLDRRVFAVSKASSRALKYHL